MVILELAAVGLAVRVEASKGWARDSEQHCHCHRLRKP